MHHELCTLRAVPNDLALVRAGIVCGKKIGGAVMRNRTKRRMRAAVRQRLASVPLGWDIVILIRPAGAQASVGQFVFALNDLLRRRGLEAQDA